MIGNCYCEAGTFFPMANLKIWPRDSLGSYLALNAPMYTLITRSITIYLGE